MNAATQFVKESYYELKKASWLTRREATDSTRAIILLVVLISLYVAGIDFILSIVLGAILGSR
jgi:preprotein translocase subunit SecE